jgi:hypothetical protein
VVHRGENGVSARIKLGAKAAWKQSQRFSPDGRLLARRTSAETVEVWDVLVGMKKPHVGFPSGVQPMEAAGILARRCIP